MNKAQLCLVGWTFLGAVKPERSRSSRNTPVGVCCGKAGERGSVKSKNKLCALRTGGRLVCRQNGEQERGKAYPRRCSRNPKGKEIPYGLLYYACRKEKMGGSVIQRGSLQNTRSCSDGCYNFRSSLRSCCLRVRNGSVLFCVFMLLTPFKRGASVGFSEPSDKKANTGKTALDCDFCNT